MKQTDPQFKLRLPQELKARLESVAASSRRSLTAEIIARLEETLEIEKALEVVAPGAPVFGTAGLLMDMHIQLKEREMDALANTMAAYGSEIEGYISSTDARLTTIEQQLKQLIELLNK